MGTLETGTDQGINAEVNIQFHDHLSQALPTNCT
jgi:hypothetical protein